MNPLPLLGRDDVRLVVGDGEVVIPVHVLEVQQTRDPVETTFGPRAAYRTFTTGPRQVRIECQQSGEAVYDSVVAEQGERNAP